jgi:hypothetical protein
MYQFQSFKEEVPVNSEIPNLLPLANLISGTLNTKTYTTRQSLIKGPLKPTPKIRLKQLTTPTCV